MAEIIFSRSARKDFSRLPLVEKKKIEKKINLLRNNPFAGKMLMGQLQGLYSERVWPYRIIYKICKKPIRIAIIRILHRQGVYR